jgi:hypothetical protein
VTERGGSRRHHPRRPGVLVRGRTDGQCATRGGATGPRGATHVRGGQEASKAAATAGAVERREWGRAARGGKAGA